MGTDVGTPGNHCGENMQEVVLMVEKCGFSPAEAIAAATVSGAELLGRADDLGQIAEGYLADVIAVPEDPIRNIAALHDVYFVMKEGTAFCDDRAWGRCETLMICAIWPRTWRLPGNRQLETVEPCRDRHAGSAQEIDPAQ